MHLSEMQQVKTAPEGLLQKMVAKSHRAASNRAAADLAGSYTWNYEMADSYSDATAERTQGSANVTISESDEVLTITGMFANPLTASYNAEYGLWVIDGTNAGTSSYGDYDVRGMFYYEGDDQYEAGWYYTSIVAAVGDDGTIYFATDTWLVRILTTGQYAGYSLTPYWAPGSTLTPTEAPDYSNALMYDDFESGELSNWTIYTNGEITEGRTDGWDIGSPASSDICNAHSGSYVAASWSWNSSPLHADNWLIAPQVNLGGSVSFWVYTNKNYPDSYEVLLSTGGNAISDFTITLQPMAPAPATGAWEQVTIDLSAYAGQKGYIAIHHQDYDENYLFIDDFAVFGENTTTGYDLSSVSNHGKVTFTVNGEEVTKAEEGKTVTVTVTPDENCFVDDIKATAYADWGDAQAPQQNNALLKDVELTPAGENTWTFTMPGAKVEVTVTYKKNVTVNVAGGDLSAALEDASEGLPICNLNLNLTGSEYTVSASIVASGNVVVNGNGATIDASALNDAFIVLDGTEEFAKKADGTDSDHKLIDVVTVKSITIKGMKGAFIKDNQKTLLQKLTVDNCVIEMPASNKNFIDFNGKGYVGEVKVQNSTIWAADKNTGFFAQYGSRPKNVNGDWLQVFDVQNSDIINIANGKNVCDLKQNGTAQNVYILKDNIFVDCGKNGQTVVGFNKGQASATPQWEVTGNSFVWGGVCTNAAEAEKAGNDIVQNSVDGVPEFADAANGDFTLGQSSDQRKYRVGDPRWFTEYYVYPAVTAAIDVNVPAMLGKMDVETTGDPTDLYYFLQSSYLNNSENPAYIKLTLEPGAIYTISQPLQVLTAIEIVGDAENPAMIDARELGANPFVQIMSDKVSIQDNNEPNAKGFFTNIYNVSFKNIRLENLKGQLFYANKQKYLIPYMTVDNCTIRMVGASKKTFFDFSGGGFVELLTINNSTLSADDATTWANGGFFSTQSGTKFEDCGAERQKFVLTNNTFYNVCKGKTTSTLRENSKAFMDFEVINNIFVNSGKKGEFVTGLNAGQNKATPNWVVNYNAFQWTEDNKTFEDISATEATKGSNCGISGSIAGEIAFLYAVDNADELLPIILIGNYTLADCPQKDAKTGDPRWIDGGTTGIQTLNAENSEKLSEGAWYTIQGVRVDKPSKGVFIHNGKKVVVK